MLAQNFMPPTELGIDSEEFGALIKVLGMLERGELIHAKPKPCSGTGPFTGHFNMAVHNTIAECGTVCCIAGTATLLIGRPLQHNRTPALRSLCYPIACGFDWEPITPAQAAIALRNYLTTGEPDWSAALTDGRHR